MGGRDRNGVVVAHHDLLETYSVQLCMQYDIFMEIDFVNDFYRIISYTEKYCNAFGMQGCFSDMVSKVLSDSIHSSDIAIFKDFFAVSRWQQGECNLKVPEIIEFRIACDEDKYRWLRMAAFQMKYGQKTVVLCYVIDISEKKIAEAIDVKSYTVNLESREKDALTNLYTHHGIKVRVDEKIASLRAGAAFL